MGILLMTKYLFIIFALLVFTITIELLLVQAATISVDRVKKLADKDGMIPIPNLLVKYSVKEYYDRYTSAANLFPKAANIVFVIISIKVLFFENIKQYYTASGIDIALLLFVLLCMFCLFICNFIIRILLLVKREGIEITKEKYAGAKKKVINKYILIVQYVSKTDDIKIANNALWIQFFINKFFTIMLITVIFFIKIALWKCKVN